MFPIPLIKRSTVAVLGDWFGAGGVAKANILAAFQPIGAASLAASYTNLVTPGTNNAAPGTAPTWDAVNGWTFTATSSQYLLVGSGALMATTPMSFVCLFNSNDVTGTYNLMAIAKTTGGVAVSQKIAAAGAIASDPIRASSFSTSESASNTTVGYTASTWYVAGGVFTSPTLRNAYINGGSTSDGVTSKDPSGMDVTIIGASHSGAAYAGFLDGKIGACAFYNIALSAAQILGISNAMLGLV